MFDLDNIDAVETPENDLEEVVMGADYQLRTSP